MTVQNETLCALWLLLHFGAGSAVSVKLIRAAGSAAAVYENPSEELGRRAGVKTSVIEGLQSSRDLSECEKHLSFCETHGIDVLTPSDDAYPKSLLSLSDMPVVLFCDGRLPDIDATLACAVVGTRKVSDYGRRMAFDLGRGLADGGAVVVSGLALGVDGIAMAAAQSVGGATVGVLGCGIDRVYPREHASLFASTRETGAIITEFVPGTRPEGYNFPKRNRIISGLCQATAVVEAGESSGSLITAKDAIYQGRAVFAVPANVGEGGSEGVNSLLRDGAHVLTSPNDILEKYEFIYPHTVRRTSLPPCTGAQVDEIYGRLTSVKAKHVPESTPAPTPAVQIPRNDASHHAELDGVSDKERAVWEAMKPGMPMLPEEIEVQGLTVGDVLASLIMLEIAGLVTSAAGGVYTRLD